MTRELRIIDIRAFVIYAEPTRLQSNATDVARWSNSHMLGIVAIDAAINTTTH
jgi:hypothetical protein